MNKRANILAWIAIFAVVLFACGGAAAAETMTEPPVKSINVTYFPGESNAVLANPYMGWAPWAKSTAHLQPFTLVYANLSWRELEPGARGDFDWAGFENRNNFSYWTSCGVKIIIRFYLDNPADRAHLDIPDWLHGAIGAYEGTAYNTSVGRGFSPNYGDSSLIFEHRRVIAALGARYGADDRIAFVELGSLGHWGEWHCWPYAPADGGPSGVFPALPVSDQYVQHYLDAFPANKLMMRRSYQKAKDNGFGLFNDMFGDKVSLDSAGWGWLWGIDRGYTDDIGQPQPAMPEFWKKAPSGGEFANNDPQVYLTDKAFGETIRQARKSHTSWLGPSCPADMAVGCPEQANIDALMKTMGYRFVLIAETHAEATAAGDSLTVAMTWRNKGVAPFYLRWPLELSLADSSGAIVAAARTDADIRSWMPGRTTVTQVLGVPFDLGEGTYTLCVAILDPSTGSPGSLWR